MVLVYNKLVTAGCLRDRQLKKTQSSPYDNLVFGPIAVLVRTILEIIT